MKASMKSKPFVSVIIPTYYDWDRLQLCINAIHKQTYPQDRFEIIIVNNAPDDKCPSSFWLPSNCIVLDEGKPGSYAARNKAISISQGEVYAFTDSDCKPKEDWLDIAIEFFNLNPNIERIGGNIKLFSENKKLTWFEIYEFFFAFPQKEFVMNSGMAATGNMISKEKVFKKVGFFNDSLMSGGDGEWGRRAHSEGCEISYLDTCIVFHPTRSDYKSINKKNNRLAGGHLMIAKDKGMLPVVILLLKTISPPVIAIKRIFNKKDESIDKKIIAVLVCYYFKLKSALEMMRLLLGVSSLERV